METEYRTVAFLRAGDLDNDHHLDGFMCARWPSGWTNGGLTMACEIQETTPDDWLLDNGFHEAFELMRVFPAMQMRARANLMYGPFIFTTDVPLDEETTLRLVLLRHEEKRRERKRAREEGA